MSADLPEVYIYMLCSMDGLSTGDYIHRKEVLMIIYLVNIHSEQKPYYVVAPFMKKASQVLLIYLNFIIPKSIEMII